MMYKPKISSLLTPRKLGSAALGLLSAGAYACAQGHYLAGGAIALAGSIVALTVALRRTPPSRGGGEGR